MATIPTSEIIAELAKHPYKQTDKVQIGGEDHYVKVFVLGTQTPKIIEDSGNPSSIAQACDDILCVGKKGIVVDGTTCYVLKETTPCGTFKRAVVFESSTNAQIVGVVDNDSVQLSTQQGGGIKVASTLPNGGDFVGQICVLTSGSTYVWTGSQWSSTAGSSTLPTPTSSNKGTYLVSNGSSWASSEQFTFVYKPADISTNYRGTPRYMGVKLSSFTASTSIKQFSFDFCIGQHASASFNGHMKITVTRETADPTRSGVTLSVYAQPPHCVLSSSSQYGRVDGVDISKYFQFSVGLVGTSSSSETREIWLLVKCMNTDDGTGRPCRDPYMTILNCIGSYLGNATPSGNWAYINSTGWDTSYSTPYGQVFYNTSVPVSTASNQMLVSDGNGGWTTFEGYYGRTITATDFHTATAYLASSKTRVYHIGSWTASSAGQKFTISADMKIGQHQAVSRCAHFDVYGLVSTNSKVNETRTWYPTWDGSLHNTDEMGANVTNPRFIIQVSGLTAQIYLAVDVATGPVCPMWSLYNLFGRSSIVFDNVGSYTYTDVDTSTIATDYILTNLSGFVALPAPTSSDNGKVLKVVNGVPTWASA